MIRREKLSWRLTTQPVLAEGHETVLGSEFFRVSNSNFPSDVRRHKIEPPVGVSAWKNPTAQMPVLSYRPSENGLKLPRLLRTPMGGQEDAIKGAALSLRAHRGTTVVGEMGTGKTFIGAAAAHRPVSGGC